MGNNIRMGLGENRVGGCGVDASGTRWGPVTDVCEHGNKPSGYIKAVNFMTS
jgi:hypothetical protein